MRKIVWTATAILTLWVAGIYSVLANNSGNSSSANYLAQATVETADTFANSTTETMLGSGVVIAANQLVLGRILELVFGGVISDTLTPTITFKLYADGVTGLAGGTPIPTATPSASGTGSQIVFNSGTITLASGITNLDWQVRVTLICVATGAPGKIEVNGIAVAGAVFAGPTGNTAPIALNTTLANTFTLSATWSAASASNTLAQRYCFPWLGN